MILRTELPMVIDSFAGGGGASTGLERALGRSVDVAVNHCPAALEMHARNHPRTLHLEEDAWHAAGRGAEIANGRGVDVLWASPDCRHFSRAKGSAPVSKRVRSLAWTVQKWIRACAPRLIFMENVPEFQHWGPLDESGMTIKARRGETYKRFIRSLRGYGYKVETRVLAACSYGVPTTRRRWYLVARKDGEDIQWPVITHGPAGSGLEPYVGAHTIIDWSLPGRSIFGRKRPLAEASMMRIAKGMKRYVFEAGDDAFIIRTGHASPKAGTGMTMRGQRLRDPLGTVCAGVNDKALIVPWVAQYFGGEVGQSMMSPLPTVTRVDHNALVCGVAEKVADRVDGRVETVRAFLTKYYGTAIGQSLFAPCGTVTGKGNHLGLIEVHGQGYQVVDITLRMLEPSELAAAQGFPSDYQLLDTKRESIAKIGNSVCPLMAELLARANDSQEAPRG